MQMPASIGQIRLTSGSRLVPTIACQTLVISAGATMIAAACAGVIISPSRPMATVGRPRPMTPLTKPASRKAPAVTAKIAYECTGAP